MPLKIASKRKNKRGSSADPEEYRMTLSEHISELRDRIVRTFVVIAVGWTVGWFIQPYLYDSLNHLVSVAVADYRKTHSDFQYSEPFKSATEAFFLKFRLSFMIGLGIALPYIVLQIWGFVSPGLKAEERRPIRRLAPLSVLLFALGVTLCWLVLPTTLRWFLSFFEDFPGTALYQEPGTMVFFMFKLMLAFGVGFQLPLVVYIAGRIGLIGPDTLIHYWRHAIAFVVITSAILTPTGDAFTLLMMAIPMTLLLAISVAAVKLTVKRSDWAPELDELD